MSISRYFSAVNMLFLLMISGLLILGSSDLFIMSYFSIFVFATIRAWLSPSRLSVKFYVAIAYVFVLILQMAICEQIFITEAEKVTVMEQFLHRFFSALVMLLPIVVSKYISVGKYSNFYLPSLQEIATISFSELKSNSSKITDTVNGLSKAGKSLSPENLKSIINELPRHDSFKYINNGTLTHEYFSEATKSIDDPFLYIVISNTGSAASELISVFTQKQYNHASLSFDRDLKTIISYNGGERVYPPGLNHEMLEFFNKKEDASIIVYRLPCTARQKKMILGRIEEINREGSAYNMMGLILKYSHKPNIMFCSQFVYNMLQFADLNYFVKKDGNIKPTDFIEQDYHRKLQFDYEIYLNQAINNENEG